MLIAGIIVTEKVSDTSTEVPVIATAPDALNLQSERCGPTGDRRSETTAGDCHRDCAADAECMVAEIESSGASEAKGAVRLVIAGNTNVRQPEQIQIEISGEPEACVGYRNVNITSKIETIQVDAQVIYRDLEARSDAITLAWCLILSRHRTRVQFEFERA